MNKLLSASPCFVVSDVQATARWYRDKLGFQFSPWGDPPTFAIAFRDGVEIFLSQRKPDAGAPPRSNRATDPIAIDAYIRVADVEALAAEIKARGQSRLQDARDRGHRPGRIRRLLRPGRRLSDRISWRIPTRLR
jgi:catechol 2,3-dioxygenase-like lactoylglutathione lyase family enzyme